MRQSASQSYLGSKLPKDERERARDAAIPTLARRLRGLTPRVVVVVVKGIAPQVAAALDRACLGAVPSEALPFPRQWHRADYVAGLTWPASEFPPHPGDT